MITENLGQILISGLFIFIGIAVIYIVYIVNQAVKRGKTQTPNRLKN